MANMTLPVSGTNPNKYATQEGLETAVEQAIEAALVPYPTTSAMNSAISAAITAALDVYPNETEMNAAIAAALADYSDTAAMNSAIGAAITSALASYPNTTAMNNAITSALASYSTTVAMNSAIAAAIGSALSAYTTTAALSAQREYVPSPAPPVLVDADSAGLARFVLLADGTMRSTQELIVRGNDVSLPGYAFVRADVAGYAVEAQRADGSFVDADPAPPRGVAGDTHLLLVDGQSPFIASATTAVSTGTVAGLKMFNAGAWPSASDFTNATTALTGFVNHVEAGNETSARGMAEGILAGAAAAGRPIVEAGSEIVSVVTAVGGQSVAALGPGGAYWHHKTAAIDRWAAICAATGKIPGQVFWGVWQGEADTSVPMGGAAWAAAWEAARVALEDYIATVIGRRIPLVQVHMQTSANYWYNRPLPLISEAANIAVRYPRIFGALPTYDYLFGGADGNGAHLSSATDSRHAGWRCGYAIGQCFAGVKPARIVPTAAVRVGARQVRVEYGGGYTAPLSLSAAVVSNPGNFGFELGSYDAAGSFAALTLTTVKVAGGEAVVLICDADLPTGPLVVRYGYIGGMLDDADPDANGSFSGRTDGARGCLQAATGRTLTIGGSTVTEYLRPGIHSIKVE